MQNETRQRILEFVRQRLLIGVPPTVREVQTEFGFRSTATAREHLDRLVTEGLLARAPGLARGLRLTGGLGSSGEAAGVRPIPILGRVQAGALTYAAEDLEGHVWAVSRYPPGELFALRVRGESMTGAGLLPGDIVLVRRQPGADSGQIVVALVEDEATVKVLFKRGGRIELRPANAAFPVLRPPPEQVRILGRVIEARRAYEQ